MRRLIGRALLPSRHHGHVRYFSSSGQKYNLTITTGNRRGASTTAQVFVQLVSVFGGVARFLFSDQFVFSVERTLKHNVFLWRVILFVTRWSSEQLRPLLALVSYAQCVSDMTMLVKRVSVGI
mmetsp:Transcript_33274/g.53606  ORF Transcript_33274/g.53606 Transcript_33274/m.53606 type:complete len:123 (-) Transcript_33274:10119-10487(-)